MSNQDIAIKSYKGTYKVQFTENVFEDISKLDSEKTYIIIDQNVAKIYTEQFRNILATFPHLLVHACEENKKLDKFTGYAEELSDNGLKRDMTLLAIGGGITQDITCFLASTLFRGLDWAFVPTTLLAQADSCIGSKSSINVGKVKNLMGTFTPPRNIYLSTQFLNTLEKGDILSGIGEMIKVHVIGGLDNFKDINDNYENILNNNSVMIEFIKKSLLLKKKLIEIDEFDKGPRNVMNYGHSFGHAIEAATNFGVPHGIAVSIGMEMANSFSNLNDSFPKILADDYNKLMQKNQIDFNGIPFVNDAFFNAISKDKKNVGKKLSLILPISENANVQKLQFDNDEVFKNFCNEFILSKGFKCS